MYIGSDDISSSTVSQNILLNRSLKMNYDQGQPKGKDTKKYF